MGRKRKELDMEKIKYYYCEKNMTVRELGGKYGVSYVTIHNRLKSSGVKVKIVRSI